MPHFIIDCSENVLNLQSPEDILTEVHNTADSTGLFGKGAIKVRITPYSMYNVGGAKDDFIHVFGNIMGGRTIEQKKGLSEKVVGKLKELFPTVPVISMNVIDFEKATYCNKTMV